MQETRKKLSLPRKSDGRSAQDQAAEAVMQGIQSRLCVRATYNRGLIMLAPHILYTRHEDRFVDGVVVERNGARPLETKLGTFKLAGLANAIVTAEPFVPFADFDGSDPRYAEAVIARLES